jgi:hypothetical protein
VGLLDGLSAGLTAATQGAGGYLAGQEQGRQQRLKEAMAAAQALRQQHQDELDMAYKSSLMDKSAFDQQQEQFKSGYRPVDQVKAAIQQSAAPTGDTAGGFAMPTNLSDVIAKSAGLGQQVSVPGSKNIPAMRMALDPTQTPEAQATRKASALQEAMDRRAAAQQTALDARTTAKGDLDYKRQVAIAQMGQSGISGTFTAPDPNDATKLVTMSYTKGGGTKVLGPAVRTQGSRSEMQRMQAERSIAGTQLMVSAHKEMEQGEAQMAANPALLKQFDQIKGDIMAHIPQGANINNLDLVEQAAATASLYTKNPILANYIRNTMMYTFGQMETLPRTSDFRTRYEQQISGIKTGMPPDQISQVTRQRKAQIHIKAQTALSQSRDWGWTPDPETMQFVGSPADNASGASATSASTKPFASLDAKSKLMASKDPAFRQHLIDTGVTGVP